uniref:Uncharacterized protein LOC100180138 n=1 Tax=Phallusia mammillata TaxID=59560 RepID=A0A6F9DH75_9ASCI|nr:uncharacterized protein LOC100180138 [Phallusia mammillata]
MSEISIEPVTDTSPTSKRCKCVSTVNISFIPVKILFFTFMAGQSTVLYRSLFMKHLGMSTTQNGIIWAIDRIWGIFVPPILGAISDKTKSPKRVIQCVILFGLLISGLMYFIPTEKSNPLHRDCYERTCYEHYRYNLSLCPTMQTTQEANNCSEIVTNNNDSSSACAAKNTGFALNTSCICILSNNEVIDQYGLTFWSLLILIVLSSIAIFGVNGVLDAFVLNKLIPSKRHKFGNQRLWGSIGFGTGALLVGYFMDRISELCLGGNTSFIPFAFSPVLFWGVMIGTIMFIESSPSERMEPVRFSHLKIIFSEIRMVVFLLFMIVLGYVIAVGESYMFWYGEEKFHAGGMIMGASVITAALIDVIMYLLSGRIIKRCGPSWVIIAGVFLLGLRLICYTTATLAWHLVASETFRGLSWAITWIACCHYIADITPPELRATMLGAVNAVLFGLGYGCGALLGGVMYESWGAENMFRLSFAFSSCACIAYATFYLCYEVPDKKQRSPKTQDETLKLREMDQTNHR